LATSVENELNPSQEQTRSKKRPWLWLVGPLLLLLVVAAVRWMLDHPYGIHWDEALYFNNLLRDLHNLHSGSLRQLGSILIGGDVRRPPANLLLSLPFVAAFGFHTFIPRLVTLACWGVSGWLAYLTTRRMGSQAAAALAVLVFCLSPEVVSASIFFSTEGPFFVATAAMLYFASFYWSDEARLPRVWIGLGAAIGLGLLAKSSFLLIAVPVLVVTIILFLLRHRWSLSAWSSFFKAGAVAFLVAAPWWIKNLGPALAYTKFAREQPRNSLGAPSLAVWAKWFFTVVVSLIGPALTILIAVIAILAFRKLVLRKEVSLERLHRAALTTCGFAILPLVALQLSGTNHLLRYLSPAVIPVAIAVGVLAEASGWIRFKPALAISGALATVQLLMLVAPVVSPNQRPVDPGFYNGGLPWRMLVRFEQWNWKPLQEISQSCGLDKPKIAFLGMGRPLNPPQILYPWFLQGSPSDRNGFYEPLWLYRYEQGPFDWNQVMSSAELSDIALTAPTFIGQATDRQNLDNEHNREFADRLAKDPLFQPPIHLQMGRFEPVEVLVFVKNGFACHSADTVQAAVN